MAKFKLRLIVPNNDNAFLNQAENEEYIASTITDFLSQRDIYEKNKEESQSTILSTALTYTYNEKVSFHKNGQKELTFTMDDKVLINNEYIQNPYARVLRVGVQIELTDKYENVYLFTVNKIQYGLHNLNIIYNVTCQDSFTYQLNRQNAGYVLSNDETSSDFIGALDIDQWADRITKDCYITYRYIPLDTGIYQYTKNGLHYIGTFEVPGDDVVLSITPQLTNVSKIIKNIYNKENYPDYYETFPFSASGSSANAALISAAETLGLQLFTVEGYSENTTSGKIVYNRFFYFGPTKNPDVSGLVYSPKQEVQNLGLSFSGDALTTVLNVKSTTWEDEEIGIFPAMPHIIQSIIMENRWTKSTYYPGFFLEKIKGNFIGDPALLDTDDITGYDLAFTDENISITSQGQGVPYTFFNINRNVLPEWPISYNKIVLSWDDEHYTSISTTADQVVSPYGDKNDILIYFSYEVQLEDDSWHQDSHFYHLDEEIDKTFLQVFNNYDAENYRNVQCALCVKGYEEHGLVNIYSFFAGLVRDYTQEEIEFATIAEECPWLENKLIDFSYFYNQGILSKAEYETLMSWLQNDLRIINGQLMCYSAAYLQGLHDQVKILSNIETSVDVLGAEFNASVVTPYQDTGEIKPSIDRFVQEYNVLFHQNAQAQNKTALIDLNNIISQKFNQYISAEQRFFKNIYNFDKYFNDINIYAKSSSFTYLNDVKYALSNDRCYTLQNGQSVIFSLSDVINYKGFDKDSPIIEGIAGTSVDPDYTNAYAVQDLYIKEKGKYIKQKIPNPKTFTEFYIPLIVKDHLTKVTSNHQYNSKNKYFLDRDSYQTLFLKTDAQIARRTIIEKDDKTYISLTLNELKVLMIGNDNDNNYYIRDTNKKVPFDWVRCNPTLIEKAISKTIWAGWNWVKLINPTIFTKDNAITYTPAGDTLQWQYGWPLYKLMLPIDNLYVKDYNINVIQVGKTSFINSYLTYLIYKPDPIDFEWKISDNNGKMYDINNLPTSLDEQYYSVPYLNIQDGLKQEILDIQNGSPLHVGTFFWFLRHQGDFATKYYALCEPQEIRNIRAIQSSSSGWSRFWGNVAGFFTGALFHTVNKEWRLDNYTQWSKSIKRQQGEGLVNVETTEGRLIADNLPYYTNVTATDAPNYLGDSIWANYTLAADSDFHSIIYTNAWLDTNYDHGHSIAEKIDGENYDYKYKHYFNFYRYIVATYSQGVLFEHNDTDDLTDNYSQAKYHQYTKGYAQDIYYVNNKYGRFCTQDDILNKNETYYLVDATKPFKDGETPTWLIKLGSNNNIPAIGRRFSTLKFYPILDNQEPISFGEIFDSDFLRGVDKITGQVFVDLLQEKTRETNSSAIVRWTKGNGGTYGNNPYLIYFKTIANGETYYKYVFLIHNEPYELAQLSWNSYVRWESPHNQKAYIGSFSGFCYKEGNDNPVDSKDLVLTPYEDEITFDILRYIQTLQDNGAVVINFPDTLNSSTEKYDIPKNTYIVTGTTTGTSRFIPQKIWYYGRNQRSYEDQADFITHSRASEIQLADLLPDICYLPAEDDKLILVSDLSSEQQLEYWSGSNCLATHWYVTDDLKSRTYSVNQILSDESEYAYYYLSGSDWSTTEIIDSKDTYIQNILIKWYTYSIDENNALIVNSENNEYNLEIKLSDFDSQTHQLDIANKLPLDFISGTQLILTRNVLLDLNISSMTNGEFWYYFKDRLDISDIMQKAAIIETQLTTYWQQAYTAAHHCKWFLPEYWQTTSTDKADNKFSQWLYVFNGSKIKLAYDLLPKVRLFDIKGQTLLPNYQYIYTDQEDLQDYKDAAAITELEIIQNNPTLLDTINHFFGVDNNLFAQEYGKTTYYVYEGGGWEWSKVAHIFDTNNKVFEYFEGLYGMQLHLLLKNYVNAETTLYEKTLKQKLNLWKMLYTRYPGIFLENTYENANARSSEQLLKMAKLAFKDYTAPEKQYNITLIDAAALQGYNGQELHLGDGILIRTSDYYDAIDETYRALNQYLFISDISYTLRKDTDIALTVNAIKYQDKLLQSIVKLIR